MIFGERVRERCCCVRAKREERKRNRERRAELSGAAKEDKENLPIWFRKAIPRCCVIIECNMACTGLG